MPETNSSLAGRHVLIVEDDFLLADDMAEALTAAGALVLGPVPDARSALALIAEDRTIDLAVLDVTLDGTLSYHVADALAARGVPFLFVTGSDLDTLPAIYQDRPVCPKPTTARRLVALAHTTLTKSVA